jgi:alpha/beta hydrolase fold
VSEVLESHELNVSHYHRNETDKEYSMTNLSGKTALVLRCQHHGHEPRTARHPSSRPEEQVSTGSFCEVEKEKSSMPFVIVPDGTRLYYEEVGAGEPLLLISGNGRDHTDWNGVRDDFADRYRVIVYDHRGTGQSDKPSAPLYSMHGFAQDAVALLDHLGIARAHVYGHSMGG